MKIGDLIEVKVEIVISQVLEEQFKILMLQIHLIKLRYMQMYNSLLHDRKVQSISILQSPHKFKIKHLKVKK